MKINRERIDPCLAKLSDGVDGDDEDEEKSLGIAHVKCHYGGNSGLWKLRVDDGDECAGRIVKRNEYGRSRRR